MGEGQGIVLTDEVVVFEVNPEADRSGPEHIPTTSRAAVSDCVTQICVGVGEGGGRTHQSCQLHIPDSSHQLLI